MKTLHYLVFLLPALIARAASPDMADFIFPVTPQTERDIKMNGKPPIRGKLLFYAPARIHIEKRDGTVVPVPPSEIDRAELNNFPESALPLFAHSSSEFSSEQAIQKSKRAMESLETENRINRQELARLLFENAALKETNTRFSAQFAKSVERKPPPVTAKSQPRKSPESVLWRQLARYAGSGPQVTAPFTISGGEWRLRWSCSAKDNLGGFLSVSSRGPDQTLLVNTVEAGSDVSYTRGKGRFALDITSAGMTWTVIVEEAVP